MAVKKKTTKATTKKPAARKAAKASAKVATKKAAVKKKATPAKTAAKKQTNTQTKSTAQASANIFAMPLPNLKEMETIMTKQPFQFDQLTQEAANNGREGVEAFVKSGEIFAKGFEEIIKTATSIAQTAGERQAEFAKQLMGSKTLNEFAEAQNKIAQSSFDQFMSGATQLSEMSVKVLSESSEPLNAQMTKTMQKANKSMAA